MTKLTNLTLNKLTAIMKPPGQNRVTTMREIPTDSSQLERWVGGQEVVQAMANSNKKTGT